MYSYKKKFNKKNHYFLLFYFNSISHTIHIKLHLKQKEKKNNLNIGHCKCFQFY